MKKIIFVHNALWIGGIETALVNMINRIDYSKYDVTCLILSNQLLIANRITDKCNLVVVDRNNLVSFEKKYRWGLLNDLKTVPDGANRIRRIAGYTAEMLTLFENAMYTRYVRSFFKNESFDVCFIFSGAASEVGSKAIKAKKYFSFYHYSDMRRVYHDDMAYKASEKIFAVSNHLAASLKEYMPEYASKIEALPNMTDIEYIRKQGDDNCSLNNKKEYVIMSSGRLVKDKGFDIAIRVCKRLVDHGYHNFHWYVLGAGAEKENLDELIHQLGVEKHFTLLGQHTNPYKYVRACDLYVQPSRIEAYGLTIIEAMILGKIVISTNTDGGKEIIQNKKNGILCDISEDSIVHAIEEVYQNKELQNTILHNIGTEDLDFSNRRVLDTIYSYIS